jgi:hypothetical protein
VQGKESEESQKLRACLQDKKSVDVVLVEAGRLGKNSLVWNEDKCKAVICMEGWRGTLPKDWTILRRRIRHESLGGVTNGEFLVHIAHRGDFRGFNWFEDLKGVPAKLNHVLTCTGSGRKVAMKDSVKRGWTEDDKLAWENRFEKIDTPTVYFKDAWLSRRLELKELKAVLDVPDGDECGSTLRNRLKAMKMPEKQYVSVLDEIRRAFVSRRGKRIRERDFGGAPTQKPPTSTSAEADVERKAATQRRETTGQGHTNTLTTKADKAVKSDDAAVPVFLWNEAICRGLTGIEAGDNGVAEALDVLRKDWLLVYWKKKVVLDLAEYLHSIKHKVSTEEYEMSRLAGVKALKYSGRAGWWKWDGGSCLFFWRWPEEYPTEIRDGLAPRFRGTPPRCTEKQRVNPDPATRAKEKLKVKKVIDFGYLVHTAWETVKSLMHFFSVDKGGTDIRMVYTSTKNGLNKVTWIPWFAIPSSTTLERLVVPGSVQADNDFEDMFLNFTLHDELQAYTGVDVLGFFLDDDDGGDCLDYVTWDRPAMGPTGSPYTCFQGACRAKRVMLGVRQNKKNPFQWDIVVTNLPGTWEHDPTMPISCTSEG